jgi:hypothetical protein
VYFSSHFQHRWIVRGFRQAKSSDSSIGGHNFNLILFTVDATVAGSAGGAVWYLVPALVIATALAPSTWAALIAGGLFSGAAIGILLLERRWPELVRPYASEGDRFADLAGNLVFAVLFTGGLVLLLVRTLDAERHRSDALLLNVLPQEIADELKRNSRVVPRHHDSVTVLFSDFVGFTQSSERLTPDEVIRLLDEAFQEFDEITQAHGLEKIKTIGDAYMAAAGIPIPRSDHAELCADMALGMALSLSRLLPTRITLSPTRLQHLSYRLKSSKELHSTWLLLLLARIRLQTRCRLQSLNLGSKTRFQTPQPAEE